MVMPYEFGFFTDGESDGFFPTDDDLVEWEICDDCGEEYPVLDGKGSCDCHMGFDGDFPMMYEYEGPYGLSGTWDD